jgi:hypothetical protein
MHRGKLAISHLPSHPLSYSFRYKCFVVGGQQMRKLWASATALSACAFVQSSQCRSVIFRHQCWLLHGIRSKNSRERCAYPSGKACCNREQLHTTCLKSTILSFETAYQTLGSFRLGGRWEKGIPGAESCELAVAGDLIDPSVIVVRTSTDG